MQRCLSSFDRVVFIFAARKMSCVCMKPTGYVSLFWLTSRGYQLCCDTSCGPS